MPEDNKLPAAGKRGPAGMNDLDVLMEFLEMPVATSESVFMKFAGEDGAVHRGRSPEQFLYLPGNREDRVLLIAHADTWWDGQEEWDPEWSGRLIEEKGVITRSNGALGADDRAGCAMLWLLKDTGHSLLITDGEEIGRRGSTWLMSENGDIADEINRSHRFAVQLDRCHGNDFKCYSVGTDEFQEYMGEATGYSGVDDGGRTDIVTLCREIAGVNLSIGYWNEHSLEEHLVLREWQRTLDLCRRWLGKEGLPKFALNSKGGLPSG